MNRMRVIAFSALCCALALTTVVLDAQNARRRAPARGGLFVSPLSAGEMANKQAVVETAKGTFVIDLLPEAAPNHVGLFITRARSGAYDGTTFHRAIKDGIVQGGDPLSKDASKRALYGTGGLGLLAAELNDQPMTAGAVAAVLRPGQPDSGGMQFFVLVTDQPALAGQYTVFGRVSEGLEIVRAISELPVDEKNALTERVVMTKVTIRDAPPPEPEPFVSESVEDLARYRVVLETTRGAITIAPLPDKAPGHVRNFLRLASLGAYDGTSFHRVVHGFMIQTGMLSTRTAPVPQRVQKYVRTLPPEFNDTPHVKGVVSMARLDDPASASTSFFICTGPAPTLDGKYTAFGRVIEGMDVVDAIDAAPVDGETPRERIEITRARVVKAE